MSIIAGVAVDAEDFVFGQVLSGTTTRIELTKFVPIGGQVAPYIWKERDGDAVSFERQVRADDRVTAVHHLEGRVDAHLYRVEWADDVDGFIDALDEHDIIVEGGYITNGGDNWVFSLRAWNQQALTSFQNTCFESGVPLDVRRVHHNPTEERTDGVESLTEGQREALVTALRRGYFEVPRGHSQTEVAEELGISRQSFSRRLRRAQQNFEDFFWKDLVAAETV